MAKLARSAGMSDRWGFTLKNPTDGEMKLLQETAHNCIFIIRGLEHHPSTAILHIPAYFEVHNGIRETKAEKLISARASFKRSRATRGHNKKLASKEQNVII
jgi:hypothetical protein